MTIKTDAALETLIRRRDDLRSGLNSISGQADRISTMRQDLAIAEDRMAKDSVALDEIDAAIKLLKQS